MKHETQHDCFSLLKAQSPPQNMVYSPLALHKGLSALSRITAGTTKAQIDRLTEGKTPGDYTSFEPYLSMGNALIINRKYKELINEALLKECLKGEDWDLFIKDFPLDTFIDDWIKEKSLGKVRHIDHFASPEDALMIYNILALQLKWKNPFMMYDTKMRPFYPADMAPYDTNTMMMNTQSKDIAFKKAKDLTVLSMDYEPFNDLLLEFVAVMPKDFESYLDHLNENSFLQDTTDLMTASEHPVGADIYLPAFKFEYSMDLVQDLKKLGVTAVFDQSADFSPLTTAPFKVRRMMQKTMLDVYEEGTSAVSIQEILCVFGMLPEPEIKPIKIRINHPFIFVIRDKRNKTVFFAGTVTKPKYSRWR